MTRSVSAAWPGSISRHSGTQFQAMNVSSSSGVDGSANRHGG
jgi:hypothetical protein